MLYRFFIYRDTFYPGNQDNPEIRDLDVADPMEYAKEQCKGSIHKIEFDLICNKTIHRKRSL